MSKTLGGENELTDISSITYVAGSTVVHEQAIDGGTEYNFNLPLDPGTPGDLLTSAGGDSNAMTWTSASFGTGTVTSVNVTTPTFMTSSGGPITTTGTITLGLSGTPLPVANGGTGTTTSTGTGSTVRSIAPTFTGITTIDTLDLLFPLGVVEGGTGVQTATGTGDTVRNTAPTMINTNLTGTTVSPGVLNVTNTTASTSSATGALTIGGGVGIVGDLNVGGSITGTSLPASINTGGVIQTTNATQSTSPTTGAIISTNVTGGLGINGNANIGGALKTFNTTQSTTTTTGALISAGGLGVALNANVGGALLVTGGLQASGITTAANTADSTAVNNGSFTSSGGVGIAKSGTWGGGITLNRSQLVSSEQLKISPSTFEGTSSIGFYRNINQTGGKFSIGTDITGVGTFIISGSGVGDMLRCDDVQTTTTGGTQIFNQLRVTGKSGGVTNSQIKISPDINGGEASIGYYPNQNESGNGFIMGINTAGTGSNHFALFQATVGVLQKWPATTTGFSTEIIGGGLEIGSGYGLTFNAGADTFTYSTGLWTPTLDGDVTYTTQTGKYVQTGAEVKVYIFVVFDVNTSGPDLQITNLPFATNPDGIGFGVIGQGGIPSTGILVSRGVASTSEMRFYNPTTEAPIVLDNTWPTVTIQGLMTYFIV